MIRARDVMRKKPGSPIEIEAHRDGGYEQFCALAAMKLRLKAGRHTLYKCSGARISHTPLTIKGEKREWTLNNYLLLLKKSPNTVTIGVGCAASLTSDEDTYLRMNQC